MLLYTYVTQSDKTNLIARKYTHVYNYIYLLFCVCYSNSVSFIELLRSVCIHGEACAKILCSEKELLNLKDSTLTQNFYGNKIGLSDRVTYCIIYSGAETDFYKSLKLKNWICELCTFSQIWLHI